MFRTLASVLLCCFFLEASFWVHFSYGDLTTCSGIVPMTERGDKISITDFGGVGDGQTLNTIAFRKAIYRIQHLRRRGGTLLFVPSGVYLTGSFNLTSHMTLYLARGAVIKATQDTSNWPLIAPLPSYGRGRERPGGRYMSFIHGDGLEDVVITGENGTIDGQGDIWWSMWRQRTLQFTRPSLVELVNSRGMVISNVIFRNSPFWNIHPVYCSDVVIRYVTIVAPPDSPNTDGIDPDSSSNVCIEDSFISTGDDLVAVKSGWDEYGIAYGRPSSYITVRRVTGSTPFAGVAVGSETSGGVENVLAENINLYNSGVGVHIKTNIGRGGVIKNITVSELFMENVRTGIKVAGDTGDHPDNNFNPNALPYVKDLTLKNIWGVNVQRAGWMHGIENATFTGICLSNVTLQGTTGPRPPSWNCNAIRGAAIEVSPRPCAELASVEQSGSCASHS
ncbi:putative polygalacturonase [Gossypium arboreum]|uniref:Uncharacterized protein n=2 Tax=Gossypium arboreum TaxID=29729 RepID=A0ABR0P0R3_GOSAR|nr:probable polygalacturonase [Gossypium arboreum]KAK5812168.1 hypothetical protein PVK06_027583 [Gossypium arboreum]KHG21610.1 putative polygalacturonase [Gossypium arboreum]